MDEDLRPLYHLLGMALNAGRRGEVEAEAEYRSEIVLHQLRKFLRKSNPILPKHADLAHRIIDEEVGR